LLESLESPAFSHGEYVNDKQTVKRRPALIISSGEYQMITDISTAGLPVPSKIRLKIFSLDISLILDKLGCLIDEDKQLFQLKIKKYL
jgi:hypothetical protein